MRLRVGRLGRRADGGQDGLLAGVRVDLRLAVLQVPRVGLAVDRLLQGLGGPRNGSAVIVPRRRSNSSERRGVTFCARTAASGVYSEPGLEQVAPATIPGRHRSQTECRLLLSLAEKRSPLAPRSPRTPPTVAAAGASPLPAFTWHFLRRAASAPRDGHQSGQERPAQPHERAL